MTAANINLYIDRGSKFEKTIIWKDSDKNLISLVGYSARMQIKEFLGDNTTILELTTENGGITLGGTEGTIALYIGATDTDNLTIDTGIYDLEVYNAGDDDEVFRVCGGFININNNITT